MPRRARVILPGEAHHVTQRGNNRQNVLLEEQDFKIYCYWLNKYAKEYKVDILAYCLMNNHVHLILIPQNHEGMSLLFRTLHMRYAQYVNHKRKMSGHLWQGRYFSCIVGKSHLYYAIRYVEQNPMRAKMVQYPWEYKWSSARWHVRKSVEAYIKVKDTTVVDSRYWKEYLINSDSDVDEQLRSKTYKGKAFASEDFIGYWESKLKCVLGDRKSGRKQKK